MARKERLTFLFVCGAGVGSSMMVKMNADEIFRNHGMKVRLISSDVTSSKSNKADCLVTTQDIYRLIKDIDVKEVILLQNMVSVKELESKIIPAYEKLSAEREGK